MDTRQKPLREEEVVSVAVRGWKVGGHAHIGEGLAALKGDDVVQEFVDQYVNRCRQCALVICA